MSVLKVNLNNIMKFDNFIKENNGKKPVNKVKSVKDGYVKIREDYIHSFIDEHQREVEEEE